MFAEVPKLYAGGARGIGIFDAAVGDIYRWMWATRFGHREETLWRLQNLDPMKPPRNIFHLHSVAGQVQDARFGTAYGG